MKDTLNSSVCVQMLVCVQMFVCADVCADVSVCVQMLVCVCVCVCRCVCWSVISELITLFLGCSRSNWPDLCYIINILTRSICSRSGAEHSRVMTSSVHLTGHERSVSLTNQRAFRGSNRNTCFHRIRIRQRPSVWSRLIQQIHRNTKASSINTMRGNTSGTHLEHIRQLGGWSTAELWRRRPDGCWTARCPDCDPEHTPGSSLCTPHTAERQTGTGTDRQRGRQAER